MRQMVKPVLVLSSLLWWGFPAFPALPDTSQPNVFIANYLRGDSLWHVDVYVAFPDAWIAAQRLQDRSDLHLVMFLRDASGQLVEQKRQKVYLTPISDYLRRFPVQTSNFFQVQAGDYHLRVILKIGQKTLWSSENLPLHLEAGTSSAIRISDLVPVAYPRISVPPFDTILWPALAPMKDDFYLYYEIHSEAPDTFVTMNADLLDANGRMIRHERYRLYVGEYSRQDYLRITVSDLPEGAYTLILRAGDSDAGIKKTFRFRVGHAFSVTQQFETNGVVWQKNRLPLKN